METGFSRRSFLYTVVGSGAAAVLAGCAGTRITSRSGLDILIRNGAVVVDNGAQTTAKPGAVIRT